uniref:cytochrome c553 n=1 Tax=Anunuuluaehu liula TaxID=3049639 RepID=UPI003001B376
MKLLSILFAILNIIFMDAQYIFAANLEEGEKIFTANCAACHINGNNVLMPDKTLKNDVLAENNMNSISAITNQVKNGKNNMPAFGERLAEDQIDNVANYVLKQAEQGW